MGYVGSTHEGAATRIGRFPTDRFPARLVWDEAEWVWKPDADASDSLVVKRFAAKGDGRGERVLVETSLGRLLLNEAFPTDFPFVDRVLKKRDLTEEIGKLVDEYTRAEVATTLDRLKDLGFEFANGGVPGYDGFGAVPTGIVYNLAVSPARVRR